MRLVDYVTQLSTFRQPTRRGLQHTKRVGLMTLSHSLALLALAGSIRGREFPYLEGVEPPPPPAVAIGATLGIRGRVGEYGRVQSLKPRRQPIHYRYRYHLIRRGNHNRHLLAGTNMVLGRPAFLLLIQATRYSTSKNAIVRRATQHAHKCYRKSNM